MPVLKKVLRNVLREPLQKATPAPVYAPDLDLKFAEELRLDPRVDFSRGSNATVVDSDGTLKWAGHNLETRSDDFGNWSLTEGSVTANQIAAPDGTTTADLFVETTSSSISRSLNGATAYTANTKYFIVVYIKNYSSDRYVQLSGFGLTANGQAPVFDPVNGTVDTNLGSRCLSASITDVGNGWYKCVAEVISTSSSNFYINIGNSATNNYSQLYTGNGTSGVYLWGAHVYQADKSMQERTDVATGLETYYPTTSSAYYAPRFDHDPATNESLGLLIEEARTNSITKSEDFSSGGGVWSSQNLTVSASTITAPDGEQSAYVLQEDSQNTFHLLIDSPTSNAATHTFSVYAKAKERDYIGLILRTDGASKRYAVVFDLANGVFADDLTFGSPIGTDYKIENAGNGWYRCSITATNTSGVVTTVISPHDDDSIADINCSYQGDGSSGIYIFGAQMEEGSFPTSYIPTSGSSVTRSADVASVATSDFNFSATEGTLFIDCDLNYTSSFTFPRVLQLSSASTETTDRISLFLYSVTNNLRYAVFTGGVSQGANSLSSDTSGERIPTKVAFAYEEDNLAGVFNGGSIVSDATADLPAIDKMSTLDIAGEPNSSFKPHLNIRRIQYFARRLDDATLQALTQPSLEPSLNLVFDSSETSYVNTGLTR